MAQESWTDLGTYLADIVSDILLKNPFSASWVYQNSVVVDKPNLSYKAPKYYNPTTSEIAKDNWKSVHEKRIKGLHRLQSCLNKNEGTGSKGEMEVKASDLLGNYDIK
jgi:hypothetical protein